MASPAAQPSDQGAGNVCAQRLRLERIMMRSDSEAAGPGWLKDIMKKKKPLSKKTDASELT